MISPRFRRTILVLGALAVAMLTGTAAISGDQVRIAGRCAIYGAGFVDLGNGTCAKLGPHVRASAATEGWNGTTANAGLRSDGVGMLPGAGDARHLRIQADPDFR